MNNMAEITTIKSGINGPVIKKNGIKHNNKT
jgi:hypothetical protein